MRLALLFLLAAVLTNLGLWVAGVDGPWTRAAVSALILCGVVTLHAAMHGLEDR